MKDRGRPGFLALVAIVAFAGACSDDGNTGGSTGQLSALLLDGMQEQTSSTTAALNAGTFDLGDLHATDDFYFLLKNNSNTIVTNITITSSNPAFTVRPATIAAMEPEDQLNVLPILRVTASHGLSSTGVGYAPLLPMDTNTTTIDIVGTAGGKQVSLPLSLSLEAKVMDADLFADGVHVDLASIPRGVIAGAGVNSIETFRLGDDSLAIKNIGNVPIRYTSQRLADGLVPVEDLTLAPGQSHDVSDPKMLYIKLCSSTVGNTDRFDIRADGCAHFVIDQGRYNPAPSPDAGVPVDGGMSVDSGK